MENLRSTVIMKTDLADFTNRVSNLSQQDLAEMLSVHKDLVSKVVSNNNGSIIKGEGDSFWITFPSVTKAALSAVEIQQEFQVVQAGNSEEDTITMRVAITIGDVLHQEGDIFGDAMNLAARIEAITPANEIYLSHAAWLVLNKAEIGQSYVNEFDIKGLDNRERVYRIDQEHKTRIIRDQIVVFTDLMGFGDFREISSMRDVELMLMQNEIVAKSCCESYGGTIRSTIGDAHFITFAEAQDAVKAIRELIVSWELFLSENGFPCHVAIGMHRGDVYIFRSCIYGPELNKAAILESITRHINPAKDDSMSLISEAIYDGIQGEIKSRTKMHDPFQTKFAKDRLKRFGFVPGEKMYEIIVDKNPEQ